MGLLPRFCVNFLYTVVSGILGLINTFLVLFRGYPTRTFSRCRKTRCAGHFARGCAFDVVEDMPGFTGRKNIDYALQLSVTYPVRYSRFLAFLRLTGIGIVRRSCRTCSARAAFPRCAPHLFRGTRGNPRDPKWPNALFDFMVRYFNYLSNVSAFMVGLVDRYPSFRFE